MTFGIEFVCGRLEKMRRAPQMWAFTKEAFVAHIVVMFEGINAPKHNVFNRLIFGNQNTVSATGLDEKVEDSWAQYIIDKANEFLLEKDIAMSEEKQQSEQPKTLSNDEIYNEVIYFLQYNGDDAVLQKVAELAELLGPFMSRSFSGTTSARKLLECKEAYIRALRTDEVERNKPPERESGAVWVRTTVVNKDPEK